ncbi:restriction endonuclease subunit S [Listeria monocytogenes]|uniref:restriction endonuclease subunit S n=1 Tax=Listeria monocytogenes TaxID=1639 RepID=UPI0010B796A7|nr:restriction endonuclease subunit S [Listeria monocytogenes]EAC3746802.1 restriction endonuclease subunit S [Listeria monocytogenes]EAD1420298.1 restriction endonuclease subunit S [Listeria monocytogenes]EHZ1286213.1 restriction endonuclease subunit S [Listeria monocytogenes]EIB2236127.1 restriction endonuclease subunit S [Listeria monocytogenes]EIP0703338.1 restriction endonuclease subunit S [Listeria monocytogenes]
MKKLEKSVPVIRFKGFSEAWEQRKLGDITESFSGGTPQAGNSDYYDGEIPFIRSGEINDEQTELFITDEGLNNSSAKIVEKGDILYALYGATSGEVGISQINGAINQAILAIRPTKDDNSYLIVQWLLKQKEAIIRTYLQGGQGNLSSSIVKELTLMLPKDKTEQAKIGVFFKQLDDTIALHQRKLNALKLMKKGFLQQMFPKSEEDVPKIRFTDFNGNWRQRKLEEVADRVRGNDRRMELPTLTISASKGWLNQHDRFFGNIAGKEQKNYTLLKKGQLSYNHGNSKSAKYGAVFVLRTYDEALVPRIYHSFKTNILANSDFIEYLFATKIPDRELRKIVSSGARMDGLLNINFNDFMSILIMLPFVEEQIKISNSLIRLDKIISLYQNKLDQLIKLKKAYLQYLFI